MCGLVLEMVNNADGKGQTLILMLNLKILEIMSKKKKKPVEKAIDDFVEGHNKKIDDITDSLKDVHILLGRMLGKKSPYEKERE